MSSPDFLLFLDFETTDLFDQKPDVIEVGVLIADMATLTRVSEWSTVLLPEWVEGPRSCARWLESFRTSCPFVYAMHSKVCSIDGAPARSLIDEVIARARAGSGEETPYWGSVVRTMMLNACDCSLGEGKESRFMLAGNSIGNMELPLLQTRYPDLSRVLHYRTMDVSTLRTFFKHIDRDRWDRIGRYDMYTDYRALLEHGHSPGDEEVHRALVDVRRSLTQLRAWRMYLNTFGVEGDVPVADMLNASKLDLPLL